MVQVQDYFLSSLHIDNYNQRGRPTFHSFIH